MSLLWAGVIIGCTFIATPAKFHANVSLPNLLQVGRVTFHAVGTVEAVLAVLMLALFLIQKPKRWIALAAPVILAIEWLLVMPPLDAQTVREIGGAPPAGAGGHIGFIALETLKLLALLYVGLFREIA